VGAGDRTGLRVNVGGMGAAWRLGESSTGRRSRATWSKKAGPAMPPSSILVTDARVALAKAVAYRFHDHQDASSTSTSTVISAAGTLSWRDARCARGMTASNRS